MTDFDELKGLTLARVTVADDRETIDFATVDGRTFRQWHSQDCCEGVQVEEVVGDLADLIGSPILLAEEAEHSDEDPPEVVVSEEDARYRESWTWTFYKLATIKGSVTIRWLGESNGYYSESVEFYESTPTTREGADR